MRTSEGGGLKIRTYADKGDRNGHKFGQNGTIPTTAYVRLLRGNLTWDSYVGLLCGNLTWDSYMGILRGN